MTRERRPGEEPLPWDAGGDAAREGAEPDAPGTAPGESAGVSEGERAAGGTEGEAPVGPTQPGEDAVRPGDDPDGAGVGDWASDDAGRREHRRWPGLEQVFPVDEERTGDALTKPPVPEALEDTGLAAPFVHDLVVKALYRHGPRTGDYLQRLVRIPFAILDDEILTLQQRHLVEVRSGTDRSRRGYTFDLTNEGKRKARELLASDPYVGTAPVPVSAYWEWTEDQKLRDHRLPPEEVREGLSHLVLGEEFIDRLGPAINSAGSLFLYGPAGNGKTAVAEAIAEMFAGTIFIPRAISVGGQIIQLYDPLYHELAEEEAEPGGAAAEKDWLRRPPDHDQRYVRIQRPVVIVGGELTLDQLELQEDPTSGVYRAPPQLKANGGVFVIDDFGRQIVRPRDLLNRWMYPLERRVDYLTLATGQKLMVPFECLLIFATNLDPADLVEEAFLRRIRYKLRMGNPSREEYGEILRRLCRREGLGGDAAAVDGAVTFIFDEYYGGPEGVEPRACHPRDLVRHIVDLAAYRGREPELNPGALREACATYFLDTSAD